MHHKEWIFIKLIILITNKFPVNIRGNPNQLFLECCSPWNPVLLLLLNMLMFHVGHVVKQIEESFHYVLADVLCISQLVLIVVFLIEEVYTPESASSFVKKVLLFVVLSVPFFLAGSLGKPVL